MNNHLIVYLQTCYHKMYHEVDIPYYGIHKVRFNS